MSHPRCLLSRFRVAGVRALVVVAAMLPEPARAIELAVDEAVFIDPELLAPPLRIRFPKSLVPLWRAGLERPDAETRRLVCDAIGLAAIRGMPGLGELEPALAAALASDPDTLVRQAAARALVSLDARGAAPALAAAASRDGPLVARIVEPALARWGATDLAEEWRARLRTADTPPALADLAIEGLGRLGAPDAAGVLEQVVNDADATPEHRLAAALALGRCRDSGLVPTATRLAATPADARRSFPPDRLGRLAAVRLLHRHADPEATDLVARLAADADGAVATAALERLDTLDPARALGIARFSLDGPDAGLRLLAVRLALRPADTDCIERVTPRLADRNPAVRRLVTGTFADFATRPELAPAVIAAVEMALAADDWRGLEQAALLAGHLDHEPAAARLVALLDHPRPEVATTAAWGLRKLAVAETLPPLLEYATALAERVDTSKHSTVVSGPQMARLCELFGILRHAPAEPLLRRFVPKTLLDERARQAAIWALGMLKEGEPDEALAEEFSGRLADVGSIPPERPWVRAASALSLGRMRAESQLDGLRLFASQEGVATETGRACHWAIERITGTPYPPLHTIEIGVRGWFLESP